MPGSTKLNKQVFRILLVLAAIAVCVMLPGLPSNRVSAIWLPRTITGQFSSVLSPDRQAAMEKLYTRYKAGDPFSLEEGNILRKFAAGGAVTDLEADVVISRALYDFYIAGKELAPEQEELFDRYSLSVTRRVTDVADRKRQLLNKRMAASPPRNAPLVVPPNDLCSGASVIPGAGPFPFLTAITPDITDATLTGDPSVPSCQTCVTDVVSRSVWYSFVPAATATYTISSCADAPTGSTVDDTVMAIYTSSGGCGGPFTEVTLACDDDRCVSEDLQAVIPDIQLSAGTTYYIVVWMCDNAAPTAGNTAVQLTVSRSLPPANDNCSLPTTLTLNNPVIGATFLAINDYELSGGACFTGVGQTQSTATGGDVVYSFTAPSAGNYSFKVTGYDTTPNLVLYVATSCPMGAPPITVSTCLAASNRSFSSSSEEVKCIGLSSGQTVFVFVDENATTGGSAFRIEATACTLETEPNATPATAGPSTFGVEGTISPPGDVDFYNLGTPPLGSRVFALVDGVASNQTNFDMRVTTALDTLEFDDLNNDPPFGSAAPNVAGTPLTGIQSFIRVNHASTAAEPYRLYAVVQPPGSNMNCNCPATNEIESNDTPGSANSASNNFFYGSLAGSAPSTDVDFFSFTANVGDLIFLSLDGDPKRDATPINGKLELVAPDGLSTLILVNDGGQSSSTSSGAGSLTAVNPNSPGEGLVWRATTTGTHFAKVSIGTTSGTSIGAGDYLLSISRNGELPTLARFSNDAANPATAIRYGDGVSIQWRTQFEVDNLGFNVYREGAGKRLRVNPEIIAGSAFLVGANTALGAGKSYAWFDDNPANNEVRYWIEALDLKGESEWHGPVGIDGHASKSAGDLGRSLTLGELGKARLDQADTQPVERKVGVGLVSKSGSAIQAALAARAAVKLSVRTEGLYRVSQPELVAVGFDPNVDPRNLQLFVDGQEQSINVIANDKFDSSAVIEFYGVGVDSSATDEHVYWLVAGSHSGKRMRQSAAPADAVRGGSFPHTVELKQRSVYFSALRNGEKENFFGAIIAGPGVDQALTIRNLDTATTNHASLEVALQGVTPAGHRVEVKINGFLAGEVAFDSQNEGRARLAIPQVLLNEGVNVVRLTARGGPSDISLVDHVRLTYWHAFLADSNHLRFTNATHQSVRVSGFSSSQLRAFDVTNASAPIELFGRIESTISDYSIVLRTSGPGTRTLVTMVNDSAKRPASIKLDRPSGLRQPGNGADFLILTRRDFMPAVEPLKALRQSQGYEVVVVDIEDVYDEFSYGNKTPQAISDFLGYARSNWKIAPRFVLLAGDASFDPKDYLGFGDKDIVPTKLFDTQLMETASDNLLASFDRDGLADIALGRLPARTAMEAARMVSRIVEYDQIARSSDVLLVADDNSEGVDFEARSAELRSLIPNDQRIEQINRGRLDPVTARTLLLDALNRGQKVIIYNGHGNADSWRGNLLTSADVKSLTNTDRLSLFVMMTCLNGYFHDAQMDSLGESLMRGEKGGAVAVWASSGMTLPGDQGVMSIELFRYLFDKTPATVGEMTLRARAATLNKDVRLTWILLGDPTMPVR